LRKQLVLALCVAIVVMTADSRQAFAQQTAITPSPNQNVPLQIQVVISRMQGEKRVSSLPYVMTTKTAGQNRGAPAIIRLGARVPVRTQQFVPASEGKPASTVNSVNYEQVGTNIDCNAIALSDGRFEVQVSINESSVITDPQELKTIQTVDNLYPVFRSYQSTNTLFLKDGETSQFTAATDRTTGEVVRVEVKVTIVK